MRFRASFQIPNCRLSIVSRLTRFESLSCLCLRLCVCRLCTTCFAKVLIWTSPAVSFSLSRIYWVCVCAQTTTLHCCKIVSLIWWNFFSEVPRLCSLIYLSSSIEIQLVSFDSVSGSSLKSFYLSGFSLISLLSFLLLAYGQLTPLVYVLSCFLFFKAIKTGPIF